MCEAAVEMAMEVKGVTRPETLQSVLVININICLTRI